MRGGEGVTGGREERKSEGLITLMIAGCICSITCKVGTVCRRLHFTFPIVPSLLEYVLFFCSPKHPTHSFTVYDMTQYTLKSLAPHLKSQVV